MELVATAIIYACITGFASLVHGMLGIGFPLVATPLLAMITDVKTAILILVLPTVVLNIASILWGGQWRRSIGVYWPLALYGMIGNFIGARLLITISPDFFRIILAGMLILYLNSERIGIGFSRVHRYPRISAAVFGLGAGLLGGTVNVMIPALIIYALEIKMPRDIMIPVFNFCFLFGKLTQGAVFIGAKLLTRDILYISIPLAILALVIMSCGMRIRGRIRARTYTRWLRVLLASMAFMLMVQFFTE